MHPNDENKNRARREEPDFFITEADGTWIVPPRADGKPRMRREPSFFTNDDDDNWYIPPENAPTPQRKATPEVDELFDRDLTGELNKAIGEVEAEQQQRPASGEYAQWTNVRPRVLRAPSGPYNVRIPAPAPDGPKVTREAFVGTHRDGAKAKTTETVSPGFEAVGTFVAQDPTQGRQLFFKPVGAKNDELLKFTGADAQQIGESAPHLIQQSLQGGRDGAPVQLSYDQGKGWSVEPAQQQQQQQRRR